MEKRTILAVALSVLVFVAYTWYQQKYLTPQQAPQSSQSSTQVREQSQQNQSPPAPNASPAEAVPAQAEAAQIPGAADTVAQAQSIVVEGDLYRAVIDNRGAVLTGWELKKYLSKQGRPFEMIAASHDSEIVATSQGPAVRSFPSTLIFPDKAVTSLANSEFYQVSVEGAQAGRAVLAPPVTVVLNLRRGDLWIEKRYTFDKKDYLLNVSATMEKAGKGLDGRFLLGQDIGPEQEHILTSAKLQAVYSVGGKTKREDPPKDAKEVKKIGTDIQWAGLDMHYFAIIAIPSQPLPYFDIQKFPVQAPTLDGGKVDRDLLRLTLPVSGSLQKCEVYLGPKKKSDLEEAGLTGVIDYGTFKILVDPLLSGLRWIYQYIHNYGFAIIVLTFLLSLLLFPFRLKQMISMKKMQVVQPKVKVIQEKYRKYKKTDPKRAEMNQEIMALYKEHNVNPLGGCLPLLLQFPLLLAFYSLLANSIELRQAPFVGYLHDLSAKDPYYVLPIIMGITMFISQKMTPMTPGTDPTQAKMMMIMPVIFTFMFLNVSSGLNLYFLCSNIFQIVFQKVAEKWMGDGRTANAT